MTASKSFIIDEENLFTNKIISKKAIGCKIENLHNLFNKNTFFNKLAKYKDRRIPSDDEYIYCIGYENVKDCSIYLRSNNKKLITEIFNALRQDKQEWEKIDGNDYISNFVIKLKIPKIDMKKMFDFKEKNIEAKLCEGITKKGNKCKNKVKNGNYCYFHKEEEDDNKTILESE